MHDCRMCVCLMALARENCAPFLCMYIYRGTRRSFVRGIVAKRLISMLHWIGQKEKEREKSSRVCARALLSRCPRVESRSLMVVELFLGIVCFLLAVKGILVLIKIYTVHKYLIMRVDRILNSVNKKIIFQSAIYAEKFSAVINFSRNI